MDDPRPAFGANVRRLRGAKGLSQEALAHESGLDRTYISGIERGVRNPSLLNICRLAGALGCQLVDLVYKVEPLPARR
ncbi:MAG: helix-turn-helix transcriptional regulator [Dehalococcoidia bacterium]